MYTAVYGAVSLRLDSGWRTLSLREYTDCSLPRQGRCVLCCFYHPSTFVSMVMVGDTYPCVPWKFHLALFVYIWAC